MCCNIASRIPQHHAVFCLFLSLQLQRAHALAQGAYCYAQSPSSQKTSDIPMHECQIYSLLVQIYPAISSVAATGARGDGFFMNMRIEGCVLSLNFFMSDEDKAHGACPLGGGSSPFSSEQHKRNSDVTASLAFNKAFASGKNPLFLFPRKWYVHGLSCVNCNCVPLAGMYAAIEEVLTR